MRLYELIDALQRLSEQGHGNLPVVDEDESAIYGAEYNDDVEGVPVVVIIRE